MVEQKETKQKPKEAVKKEAAKEAAEKKEPKEEVEDAWKPKTRLGRRVKEGEITEIDHILDRGHAVLEKEIVERLLPNLEADLLLVGQSKGKFGGGKRRVFRQTQKKTREGNKPHFATFAVVGNRNGYVGLGYGKSKETVPAREKAIRKAKLNIIKIRRGCGSWQCGCGTPHSIPFAVEGKCGSVKIRLMPAPKGKGLCVEKECQKILELAGIKDVWSKTAGQTRKKNNLITACLNALRNLVDTKLSQEDMKRLSIVEGKHVEEVEETPVQEVTEEPAKETEKIPEPVQAKAVKNEG